LLQQLHQEISWWYWKGIRFCS